jgi:hypothetical protein
VQEAKLIAAKMGATLYSEYELEDGVEVME